MLPDDGCMENFIKKSNLNKNRQELGVFYRENGAVYVAYLDYLEKQQSFYGPSTFAYRMSTECSVDVDREDDLGFCEYLLERQK